MTILESATLCKGLFREYLDLLSHFDRDRLPLVTDSSDRFGSWAYSTGAISNNRDSMDWRLVVGSVLQDSIESLLTRLAGVIKSEIIDLDLRIPGQISSIIRPGVDKQASIDDVLEELFQQWRLLTRSAALNLRADDASDYFEYDEQRVNLTEKFKVGIRYYLETTLSYTSKVIRRRLENTIFSRHQYLCSLKTEVLKERDLRLSNGSELEKSCPTSKGLCEDENGPSMGAGAALQSSHQPHCSIKRVPTQRGFSIRTAATACAFEAGDHTRRSRKKTRPCFPQRISRLALLVAPRWNVPTALKCVSRKILLGRIGRT